MIGKEELKNLPKNSSRKGKKGLVILDGSANVKMDNLDRVVVGTEPESGALVAEKRFRSEVLVDASSFGDAMVDGVNLEEDVVCDGSRVSTALIGTKYYYSPHFELIFELVMERNVYLEKEIGKKIENWVRKRKKGLRRSAEEILPQLNLIEGGEEEQNEVGNKKRIRRDVNLELFHLELNEDGLMSRDVNPMTNLGEGKFSSLEINVVSSQKHERNSDDECLRSRQKHLLVSYEDMVPSQLLIVFRDLKALGRASVIIMYDGVLWNVFEFQHNRLRFFSDFVNEFRQKSKDMINREIYESIRRTMFIIWNVDLFTLTM
jgi:hypothetical protein